jgi:hypothetical protein
VCVVYSFIEPGEDAPDEYDDPFMDVYEKYVELYSNGGAGAGGTTTTINPEPTAPSRFFFFLFFSFFHFFFFFSFIHFSFLFISLIYFCCGFVKRSLKPRLSLRKNRKVFIFANSTFINFLSIN